MPRISLIAPVALALLAPFSALAQAPAPPAREASVVDAIETVAARQETFLPKYRPEWFLAGGYSGTIMSPTRQYPTLALQAEGIFFRPGRFDIGVYLEGRFGRPDENEGRFALGLGPEFMWRFVEESIYDFAAVLRGDYLVDTTHPDNPLFRPQVGVQGSLVRSIAVQLTYDQLISLDREFSNGSHIGHGFSVIFKVGLCPWWNFCGQQRKPPIGTLDRSPVSCKDAAAVCRAAASGPPHGNDALCTAAQRALDPSHYPADWGDPVGSFLRALRTESGALVSKPTLDALAQLQEGHAASIRGIDDYSDRTRALGPEQALSARYSYVVSPVMIRDWLGCGANGAFLTCASEDVCSRDTGVAADWSE